MQFACNLKVLPFEDVKIKTYSVNFIIVIFCCGWHPVVFIKLKDNKIVYGFSHTQQYIYYIFILTTYCGQLTFTRPPLENLQSGTCSANSIRVTWDPIWMPFELHVPYSKFCKAGLMMVSWPKHVAKVKIKWNTLLCLTETRNYFVVF